MIVEKNKKRIKRSDEELRLEALKYVTKIHFQNRSNAHYKQAWRKGKIFLDNICSHMDIKWEAKWHTLEEVQIEANKYDSRTSFARGSSGAYAKAQRMGWLDQICSFMGEKSNEAYTCDELRQIALKYGSKEELRKNEDGVYHAARRLGILEDICSHMDAIWEIKWNTFEKIHKEALIYTRRGEFKKNSNGAWCAARNKGILDQVCSHMKKSHSISLKEEELYNIIKSIFYNVKTLRDKKVVIKDKPYIKRFDIDIFVPELSKGIEFDGTYYHSFEFMRKSKRRSEWSNQDVLDYHEIKDSWFLSKGIQILHIKEEEWDLNQEDCIKRCLEFLGDTYEQKIA